MSDRQSRRKRDLVAEGVWVSIWRIALILGPILIVDKLILGHAMPDWIAGSMGLTAGILGLWITPWLCRWRTGLSIWFRVCNDLMKGHS